MKPIEHIKVQDLFAEAEKEVASDRAAHAKAQIKKLMQTLYKIERNIPQLEEQLKKLKDQQNNLWQKLNDIRCGEWSKLDEEKNA